MTEKEYTIIDEVGIQARTATILVNTANKFSADLSLEYNNKKANLKSIMSVISLGVTKGSVVKVSASGSDEVEGIAAVTETMKENHLISE
jgi:phosphocarrier protein HPr